MGLQRLGHKRHYHSCLVLDPPIFFFEESWQFISFYHPCDQIHDEKQLKAGRIYSGFAIFYSEETILVWACGGDAL